MTVIAAVARAAKVTMAADTASIIDGRISHDGSKIFTTPFAEESVAFGFAGVAQLGDLVEHHITLAHPPPGDPRGWLTGIAIDISQIAADAKPPVVDEDGAVNGYALAGFRGQLWLLAQQAVVHIDSGFYTIGSGGDVALGVLAVLDGSDMPDQDIVTEAVKTAARFCDTVGVGPDGPQVVTV